MLDGLAFLPTDDVIAEMDFLKTIISPGLDDLVNYFDSVYVSGTYRRIQPPPVQAGGILPPMRMRRIPPLVPPHIWDVHAATMNNEARTNNVSESWNFSFKRLIGHGNPSLWTAIQTIGKDQAFVATFIEHKFQW